MSLTTSEAAMVYSALILHDDGLEITADKLNTLIASAGIEIESIWPSLFAKALEGKDVGSFLFAVGSGSGGAAAGPVAAATEAAPAAAAAGKKEEKKEEKEESDDDMGFGLFD
ncbi:60S acidic ribosomal protein P1 [Chytriomyces hyalinus]|nr:60s acidic ribosomal protein-domain-containing protein [Chytriomyces cf. hyalinus JEL632]KAJ3225350.1 60S acidic ribosomal protein P1 [Chytriomyces hyalinus]KAI8828962.1 60s acidic ribosomal protein-domain-containing protein [Chytriomyces cf. hyalinus JEL632]KAI8836443.1 60s acidic ribosomal protein-domain-containing protein [Chytriomyces cf. hyalinus JEL632]KAI8836479.1 60s acidic ribosomal protein-domain-containing protein [Chytriomyces cf. hyalinus JEL632]